MNDGFTLRYDIDRDTLTPALAALRAAGTDMTEVMDDLGVALVSNAVSRFETETGPDGVKWKASARATASGGKTLTDSGALMGGLTHRPFATGVEWGSDRIYARIHQLGGVIRPKNGKALRFPVGDGFATVKSVTIPARPYLGWTDEDRDDAASIFEDYLRRVASTAGSQAGGGQ